MPKTSIEIPLGKARIENRYKQTH